MWVYFSFRMQRVLLLFCFSFLLTALVLAEKHHKAEIEDNEFAEFEEFDEEEEVIPKEEDISKVNPEVKSVPPPSPSFDDDVRIEVCSIFLQ